MHSSQNLKTLAISKLSWPRGEAIELNDLLSRCEMYTRMDGTKGTYECYIKGNIGKKVINRRRIFTGGPFGNIQYASGKYLFIEISTKELLFFLGESDKWSRAMSRYAIEKWGTNIDKENMEIFISSLTHLKISEEFQNKLFSYSSGAVISLVIDILNMDILAHEKKWKYMDESKWGDKYLSSKDNVKSYHQRAKKS